MTNGQTQKDVPHLRPLSSRPFALTSTNTRAHNQKKGPTVKITYDTETDSISVPKLTGEQNAQLQSQLSAALYRNDPVQTVAAQIMTAARALSTGSDK